MERGEGIICYWCGETSDEWTIDHIIPLALGVKLGSQNMVRSCRTCNQTKADLLPRQLVIPFVRQIRCAIGRLRSSGKPVTVSNVLWTVHTVGPHPVGEGMVREYLCRYGPVTDGAGEPLLPKNASKREKLRYALRDARGHGLHVSGIWVPAKR